MKKVENLVKQLNELGATEMILTLKEPQFLDLLNDIQSHLDGHLEVDNLDSTNIVTGKPYFILRYFGVNLHFTHE